MIKPKLHPETETYKKEENFILAGIDIDFFSLVGLWIKIILAAIPAVIIIAVTFLLLAYTFN